MAGAPVLQHGSLGGPGVAPPPPATADPSKGAPSTSIERGHARLHPTQEAPIATEPDQGEGAGPDDADRLVAQGAEAGGAPIRLRPAHSAPLCGPGWRCTASKRSWRAATSATSGFAPPRCRSANARRSWGLMLTRSAAAVMAVSRAARSSSTSTGRPVTGSPPAPTPRLTGGPPGSSPRRPAPRGPGDRLVRGKERPVLLLQLDRHRVARAAGQEQQARGQFIGQRLLGHWHPAVDPGPGHPLADFILAVWSPHHLDFLLGPEAEDQMRADL